MKLGRLINGIDFLEFEGDPDHEIQGLAYDSREVRPGYLFVAVKGHVLDGHRFFSDALKRGAVALVGESFDVIGKTEAARIRVPNSRKALSLLADRFYSHPSAKLRLIGITGTNGKTTTAYLLEAVLSAAGRRTGVIGTINYRIGAQCWPAPVTTPESLDLMRLLRRMKDAGATDVIIEVSSHALEQGRIGECIFEVGVFTNLTRDHLDYHGTMDAYFEAKSRLFRSLAPAATAVINLDDPRGKTLWGMTRAKVLTYGLREEGEIRSRVLSSDKNGLRIEIRTPAGVTELRSPLLGEVNVYNIMAAMGAALALGVDFETAVRGIESLERVPGRLERVENALGRLVVVDYAHTPDALYKAMKTLKPLAEGRLITVFGCGGDRDRGKRFEMGVAAGENSDLVIVTSDNPRSEDPLSIMEEIEKGVQEAGKQRIEGTGPYSLSGYLMEVDRRKAIRKAIQVAGEGDLILIAGKGHEDYQIVGGVRKHFDDREEVLLAAGGGT
ncbi:MAG: UDP-N-acetylmuramoyl-L-alanyl-D-glutamate--2,6-diaminopimelate ligase [Deltaproteobacteria bacterium]|nr:UDP-N-acetylmuramoyl-L-alanyl-D-glutamate--2,6-diaminopimelate ligase [Deltaproteobacteria bacterium]MBW2128285.1 UDP-N-acetylmuramoyl-L-alanyl-D-glutamate--2,6-diaminopimelate ligase [Deltaproteobacteria bacterium]